MIEGPCRVISTQTSKTGKHGIAKVHISGIDIFTGKRLETLSQATAHLGIPMVHRAEYDLVDIDETGSCTLFSSDQNETFRVWVLGF